jgi:ABC-type glycerol-3-phosphate transport system substrate-binding protein
MGQGDNEMGRNSTRRSVAAVALAATGALALAACGTGGAAEAPRSARPAVTLDFWSRMGQGAGRAYIETGEFEEKRLPVFMEQHAPVKVNRTVISNGDELLQ